ncbi:MAG: guanylate kinase [Candidatus Sulfobium sp.]|jgi:guanylate kinase
MFIISAPSGAGKTTLCNRIVRKVPDLRQSVSFTTRQPRRGEVNDRDYTFISEPEFRSMAGAGDFVEWAVVHGNFYGTSRRRLEGILQDGFDVLLDIDTQGARQVRDSCSGGAYVFILPPSMEALRGRLEKRGSNTRADMERRLARAVEEIRDYSMFDYVIVNDVLKDAVRSLESVITAERLKSGRVDKVWLEKNFLG